MALHHKMAEEVVQEVNEGLVKEEVPVDVTWVVQMVGRAKEKPRAGEARWNPARKNPRQQ